MRIKLAFVQSYHTGWRSGCQLIEISDGRRLTGDLPSEWVDAKADARMRMIRLESQAAAEVVGTQFEEAQTTADSRIAQLEEAKAAADHP